MPEFQIQYSITLYGTFVVEAASEDEAVEAFEDTARADLVADAEYANADVDINEIECEAHPLEQLAEQAE
jgi:hypothetical protein